ncbi:hypothetical protein [Pantanalinema sp. GBBB05]|uniref:hypothetical protein n=1 Tax=Pantanalinema sp. GBBB05 TaxID=2604139 RepID=UPI001D309DF3|nr:hypothetical protein [Pantanalinema sp. GBBB05]
MNHKSFFPTVDQVTQTQQAIAAYVQQVDAHPDRRVGAYPYALLHEPGQPIYGTVMMFHGFSAKPHQMWRLADYLFLEPLPRLKPVGFRLQTEIAG